MSFLNDDTHHRCVAKSGPNVQVSFDPCVILAVRALHGDQVVPAHVFQSGCSRRAGRDESIGCFFFKRYGKNVIATIAP